jgi:hypothetical protein
MIRATLLALSILISFPAQAIPCWIVRKAVADYGEAAVESWARGKGYSEKQIAEHRKCLRR